MAQTRHFMGWDEPVIRKVVAFLLPLDCDGPVDLSGDLIVVPTRQAGRRLRRALAVACAARNTALLSARIVAHNALLHSDPVTQPLAGPCIERAVWARLLMDCNLSDFSGLFPTPVATRDFAWAVHTANLIQDLRRSLVDGGHQISDVPAALQEGQCPEPDRWRDLAALEAQYIDRLDRLRLGDPLTQQIRHAQTMRPPEGVDRVVVAAVPDPTPLVVRALERLANEAPVVVLVHAPPESADAFDPWGRPRPSSWDGCLIDIPDPQRNVLLAASPASQSRLALDVLAQEAGRFGPADVTVGVPDSECVPSLIERFSRHDLLAYDPAGQSVSKHPLYHLLDAWRNLLAGSSFEALGRLLRHPDLLELFQHRDGLPTRRLLEQADQFQNQHLPRVLDDVLHHLEQSSPRDRGGYPDFEKAVAWVQSYADLQGAETLDAAVRRLLQEVYAHRSLHEGRPCDESFVAVAAVVNEALDQIGNRLLEAVGLDRQQGLELLADQLAQQVYYVQQQDAAIGLEGWLELPWSDAPLLVVTGMNEGCVPNSPMGDLFLPDSLRQQLNLTCDKDRLARDVYLTRSLIAARSKAGRVCFIAGKTSSNGDPLKPSRLLFRCGDDDLPARAGRLFGPATQPQQTVAFEVSFKLRVGPPPDVQIGDVRPDKISVTAFRNYLACPFRFYLSHGLGMKALDDRKTSLDALDFGSMVHRAMQLLSQSRSLRDSKDEKSLGQALCAEAQRWVDQRFGSAPPLPVVIQLDAAKQRLIAAARCHVALVSEGWETIDFEYPVTGSIDGMTVRGRVDRIDRHRKTGALRLLDYKTSDTATQPPAAHLGAVRSHTAPYATVSVKNRQMAWLDLQLPLYRLLLAQSGYAGAQRTPMAVGYFNLPKAVGQTGVVSWEGFNEDLLASAATCAGGVVGDMLEGRFWPPAQQPRYDDFQRLFYADPDTCIDTDTFERFMVERL